MAKLSRDPLTLTTLETETRRALAVLDRALPPDHGRDTADWRALRAAVLPVLVRELLEHRLRHRRPLHHRPERNHHMTTPTPAAPVVVIFTLADLTSVRFEGDNHVLISGTDTADLSRVVIRVRESDAVDLSRVTGDGDPVLAIDPSEVTERRPLRRAVVARSAGLPAPQTVEAYLWGGYQIAAVTDTAVLFWGHDNAGFTLESLCDRLASGVIYARPGPDPDPAQVPAMLWPPSVMPLTLAEATAAITAGDHPHDRHPGPDAALTGALASGALVAGRTRGGDLHFMVTAAAVAAAGRPVGVLDVIRRPS